MGIKRPAVQKSRTAKCGLAFFSQPTHLLLKERLCLTLASKGPPRLCQSLDMIGRWCSPAGDGKHLLEICWVLAWIGISNLQIGVRDL